MIGKKTTREKIFYLVSLEEESKLNLNSRSVVVSEIE